MRANAFMFIATLYVMAISSFVIFATSIVPWVQFHYFSTPATLFESSESEIDDVRAQRGIVDTLGTAVRLELSSGEELETHAHLTSEQLRGARSEQGLHVLFRNVSDNKVKIVTSLQDLDSPWLWLIFCFGFAVVANYSRKLPTHNNA